MKPILHGSVTLPGSKSESNRALMIAAYLFETENGKRRTENVPFSFLRFPFPVSEAHDTQLLQSLLNTIVESQGASPVLVDCEDAGTVARFLLPLLCSREGTWLMTGTERMCQRPMGPLVDALRQLGAEIDCQRGEGHLPLFVKGKPILGGTVALDATQSSQFVSALLMAAPIWKNGLQLRLTGPVASTPYVSMTMAMMRHFGAEARRHGEVIMVAAKPYHEALFEVSVDWSAASYWYELVALCQGGGLLLKGLRPETLQGDVVVSKWYENLGVHTEFGPLGATLTKKEITVNLDDTTSCFDFNEVPDLFPSVFVTCIALHIPAVFTGVKNLTLKESDRVRCLVAEMEKLYSFTTIIEEDKITISKSSLLYSNNSYKNRTIFNNYNDHRIAMAGAPLKTVFPALVFDHPEVVAKSYPNYWTEFESVTGL